MSRGTGQRPESHGGGGSRTPGVVPGAADSAGKADSGSTRAAAPEDYGRLVAQALDWAIDDAGRYLSRSEQERLAPTGRVEADRRLLDALLTLREPGPVPPQPAAAIDALLGVESRDRGVVDAAALPRVASSGPLSAVALWQGDITRLRVGGVVNAANSAMLGCRIPGHACIDNAIHAAAGPRLRNACAQHMRSQGSPEPTGTATLTPGFSLPAQAVIHTVGPVVSGREPTEEDAGLLASCYRSCLDAAQGAGLDSIALCSVSTGVFGYPVEQAARVALREILNWLGEHGAGSGGGGGGVVPQGAGAEASASPGVRTGRGAAAGGAVGARGAEGAAEVAGAAGARGAARVAGRAGDSKAMLVVIDTFSHHDTEVYQALLREYQAEENWGR